MKKILAVVVACATLFTIAGPGPGPHHGPIGHPPAHHHHHHSAWGRGGSHFWPGFTGALVGSLIAPPPPPAPVVVVPAAPGPYISSRVWIAGHYEDRLQPNGTVVRIWIPGYWR